MLELRHQEDRFFIQTLNVKQVLTCKVHHTDKGSRCLAIEPVGGGI